MQYLFHRNTQGGLLGFTGHFVDHLRNSHNYMADLNAEKQLNEQADALIKYLAGRPLSNSGTVTLSEEYVRVVDDLYTRGFLEAGDVKAAMAWAQLLPSFVPLSDPTITNSINKGTEKVKGTTVVVSVEDLPLVPIVVAIYSPFYESIVLVTTNSHPESTKVNGSPYHTSITSMRMLLLMNSTKLSKRDSLIIQRPLYLLHLVQREHHPHRDKSHQDRHTQGVEDEWKCSDVCLL